jgi:DNA polymerase III delta subunit
MSAPTVYLFLGPDRARKFQRVHELDRALKVSPLDRHHLDAAGLRPAELLLLVRQAPAAGTARLIVVDQANRLDAAAASGLLELAESGGIPNCVVLLSEAELGAKQALAHPGEAVAVERFPLRNTPAVKPFALTDALGTRDAATALGAFRDQLLAGKDALEVMGLITWQLNRWMAIKRLAGAAYSVDQMTAVTGLHAWQVQRLQSEVSRRSLPSLQQLLTRCWRLEMDAKRGRSNPELAVEQLIVEVCGA